MGFDNSFSAFFPGWFSAFVLVCSTFSARTFGKLTDVQDELEQRSLSASSIPAEGTPIYSLFSSSLYLGKEA